MQAQPSAQAKPRVMVLDLFAGSFIPSRLPRLKAFHRSLSRMRIIANLAVEKDAKLAAKHGLQPGQVGCQVQLQEADCLTLSGDADATIGDPSVDAKIIQFAIDRLHRCDAVLIFGGPPCQPFSNLRSIAPTAEETAAGMYTVKVYLKIVSSLSQAAKKMCADKEPLVAFVMENPHGTKEYALRKCIRKDAVCMDLLDQLGASKHTVHQWSEYSTQAPRKTTDVWSNLPLQDTVGRSSAAARASTQAGEYGKYRERYGVVADLGSRGSNSKSKRRKLQQLLEEAENAGHGGDDSDAQVSGSSASDGLLDSAVDVAAVSDGESDGDYQAADSSSVAFRRSKWPDEFVRVVYATALQVLSSRRASQARTGGRAF